MIFDGLIELFKRLFPGVKPRTNDAEQKTNTGYVIQYEDIDGLNIPALVAGRLANIVSSEAKIQVAGENKRAVFLDKTLSDCTANLRNIVCRELGTGGLVLKPYTYNGRILTDIIGQERFIDVEQKGDIITKAGFVADAFVKNGKKYTRVEYHALEDSGVYTIEQKALENETELPLTLIPEWAEIKPVVSISGVKQMLFAFLKCPVDNRRQFSNIYGVPLTYGQDKLMAEITELFKEMQKEFSLKTAFIGIDTTLFNGKDALPSDGIYKKFNTDRDDFFEIFSPDIRQQSYIDGINYKMEMLEKAIGVSKGVLTNLDTKDATATEIRRSLFDTFTMVDNIRTSLETAINQLVYAYDVIANVNGLAPGGDYEVNFDWSYNLLEDSAETFNQLLAGQAAGDVNGFELRQFLFDEDKETAIDNMPEQLEPQLIPGE